jgi:hypothetical protein
MFDDVSYKYPYITAQTIIFRYYWQNGKERYMCTQHIPCTCMTVNISLTIVSTPLPLPWPWFRFRYWNLTNKCLLPTLPVLPLGGGGGFSNNDSTFPRQQMDFLHMYGYTLLCINKTHNNIQRKRKERQNVAVIELCRENRFQEGESDHSTGT